jgi:hypothetical protein
VVAAVALVVEDAIVRTNVKTQWMTQWVVRVQLQIF